MKKKKILYIATVANNRNRLDGETVKCRLLNEYLNDITELKVKTIDTDNWKKHIFKLVFLIVFYYFWCDKIIVSSADRGAHIVLSFFNKIHCKKEIYYFVIGGSLYRNITEKKWNVTDYTNLECIYVEAETLKNNLNLLQINNVEVVNNFRKIKKFKNNYLKEDRVKFVYFGRIIKEKGVEEAIKLIKKLNEDNIKCTLDLYGQCKEDYLKIIEQSFDKNIVFHGEIKPNNKNEYEILSQYDIFIFPTEYPGECLPGALIDCYISGLAVVASNWTYAKEYVEDGKNGVIFEYQNYHDMYDKTLKMIKDDKIAEFKKRSLKIADKYLIENVLKDFKNKIR